MSTTYHKKFKGEIEKYLSNGLHNFESKIDGAFSALKFKTLKDDLKILSQFNCVNAAPADHSD